MANIDTHASRQEQPAPADQALARRIAERVHRLETPQPWTNGYLDGEVRAAADRLLAGIQDLDDAAQAPEERACRADTLVAALDAEQAVWAATEDGGRGGGRAARPRNDRDGDERRQPTAQGRDDIRTRLVTVA